MIIIGVVVGFIIGAAANPSVNEIVDPEQKSDDYHVDWFSRRAVYEYAKDVDPAIDCS